MEITGKGQGSAGLREKEVPESVVDNDFIALGQLTIAKREFVAVVSKCN